MIEQGGVISIFLFFFFSFLTSYFTRRDDGFTCEFGIFTEDRLYRLISTVLGWNTVWSLFVS